MSRYRSHTRHAYAASVFLSLSLARCGSATLREVFLDGEKDGRHRLLAWPLAIGPSSKLIAAVLFLLVPSVEIMLTRTVVVSLLACVWQLGELYGQERPVGPAAAGATAQERLLMEQIDQLAADEQFAEAIASLERLVDNAEGRLMELGTAQRAATLAVQLHMPIARWAQWRLHAWSLIAASAIPVQQEMAERGSDQAMAHHDFSELQKVVDRYPLAPASIFARLFLCDLYLDRGWTVAARQALDAPGPALRMTPLATADSSQTAANRFSAGLPWPTAWPHVRKSEQRAALLDQSRAAIAGMTQTNGAGQSDDDLVAEVVARLVMIAVFDCPRAEFDDTCEFARAMGERLSPTASARTLAAVTAAEKWFDERQALDLAQSSGEWLTFAGNAARCGTAEGTLSDASWPSWSVQLERVTGSTDRNPASKPPVAENTLGLVPYHPAVHNGRVYVNELTRVVAFDLKDGRSWPPTDPALPVFDSGMTASNYLPFGYALMGVPRGTLMIDRDTLYARMGPPVSGWYGNAPGNDAHSRSYLVALDLARQGSMRQGFPVRLSAAQFPDSEFEGTPLAIANQLVAAVGTRDNVSLRRSVVSIERDTGAVLWRSPTLASGTVSGSEQASLVAHQLLTASGGRIFVNTNLGAIACLDQSTGGIVWLARYRRSPPSIDQAYPHQDRYRYRDLTPCMVTGTQVICAPQDCPEIFALDATSGDLLWSTGAEQVDEATQLLGASSNSIVLGGDRIFWLERTSGRVIAAFPAGSTGDAASALPAPRGYGRGIVSSEHVYWPTQQEIFVFDADQVGRAIEGTPHIRDRMRLDTRGAEGGNLVLFEDGMIIAGASR